MIGAVSWMLGANLLLQGSRLVVLMILARLLTPDEFGLVALCVSMYTLAECLATLGLPTALIQVKECPPLLASSVLAVNSLVAILIAMVPLACLLWLGSTAEQSLWTPLAFLGIVLIIGTAGETSLSLLQRQMRFRLVALIDVFAYVVGAGLLSLLLAFRGFGVWAILAGMAARYFLRTVLLQWFCPVRAVVQPARDELSKVARIGLSLVSGQMASTVAGKVDNLICAWFLGLHQLGIYTRAYSVIELANTALGQALRTGVFAGFAVALRSGPASERERASFRDLHFLVALISIPGSVACVAVGGEVVRLILGPGWQQVEVPLAVLGLGIYFRLATKMAASVLLAAGESRMVAAQHWRMAAGVTLCALGGSVFGLVGIATGVLIVLLVQWLILMRLALVSLGGTPGAFVGNWFVAGVAGIGIGVVAAFAAGLARTGAMMTAMPLMVFVLVFLLGIWTLGRGAFARLSAREASGDDVERVVAS